MNNKVKLALKIGGYAFAGIMTISEMMTKDKNAEALQNLQTKYDKLEKIVYRKKR